MAKHVRKTKSQQSEKIEVADEDDTGLSSEMPLKEMSTWQMRKNRLYLEGRCGQQGRNVLGLAEHDPAFLLHSDRKELIPFLVSRDSASCISSLFPNQIWLLEEVNAKL